MNEDDLKALFGQTEKTPIDENKKARALALAASEFSQRVLPVDSTDITDNQGNIDSPRLMHDNVTYLKEKNNMEPTTGQLTTEQPIKEQQTSQRWAYGGLASAAVVVVAVTLVFNLNTVEQETFPDSYTLLPETLNESRIELDTVNQGTVNQGTFNQGTLGADLAAAKSQKAKENQARQIAQDRVIAAPANDVQNETASLQELLEKVNSGKVNASNLASTSHSAQELNFARTPQYKKRPDQLAEPIPRPFVQPSSQQQTKNNFSEVEVNPVFATLENPFSTFSIDVDTASYSFVRKQLQRGVLPEKAAVRLEEMVNYFDYDYPTPNSADRPFQPTVSVTQSPWNPTNRLVQIGIKGYEAPAKLDVRSNIVFLLDVSGSMNRPDKLPLVKQSMSLLLSQLHPEDTVSIAVYAGAAGVVLEPTKVKEKRTILSALHRLQAGGSTAGAQGIQLAYQLAEENFVEGGYNRVFLATDGDFNVGITDQAELQGFIERKRNSGVYLSILGFGDGNYQDALMQKLAQNGNGIAAYIDSLGEAQKVLVEEAQAQLFPIANDVKIQVEFNPNTVSEYRLLGYETRALAREDFNNDKVDAGEIGAGHSVTAIYEITPKGEVGLLSPSRYQDSNKGLGHSDSLAQSELAHLKIRYKKPGESTSKLIEQSIGTTMPVVSIDSRFAIAVAGFAQLLKGGQYTGDLSYDDVLTLASGTKGQDEYGYRAEFIQLVRAAKIADEL